MIDSHLETHPIAFAFGLDAGRRRVAGERSAVPIEVLEMLEEIQLLTCRRISGILRHAGIEGLRLAAGKLWDRESRQNPDHGDHHEKLDERQPPIPAFAPRHIIRGEQR